MKQEAMLFNHRCPCGRDFMVEDEEDLDAQLFNETRRRSKRHRDKLFEVCQYLWKVDDAIEVLKITRLYTADMIFINLILKFSEINPLKYPLVKF